MKIDVAIHRTGPMDESLRLALAERRHERFRAAPPDEDGDFPKHLPQLRAELATVTWPDGSTSTVDANFGDIDEEAMQFRHTAEKNGLLAREIRIYTRCPQSGSLHSIPTELLALVNYTAPLAVRTAARHMDVAQLANLLRLIYAHDCIDDPEARPGQFQVMEKNVMAHAKLGISLAHSAAMDALRRTAEEFEYANAFNEARDGRSVNEVKYWIERDPELLEAPDNAMTSHYPDAAQLYGDVEHETLTLAPNGERALTRGPCPDCGRQDAAQIVAHMRRGPASMGARYYRVCLECGNANA